MEQTNGWMGRLTRTQQAYDFTSGAQVLSYKLAPMKSSSNPVQEGPEPGFPTSLSLVPFLPPSGGQSVHLLQGHLQPDLLLPWLGLKRTGLGRQAAS